MQITSLILKDCPEVARIHQRVFFKGWNERDFLEFLQNPLIYGLKIEEDHKLSAYMLWREVGDEAEILTVVVVPPYQRMGKGSILIKTLFEHLIKKGLLKLFLEVAEDNKQAQAFYIKHGFKFLSKRPNYYSRKNNKVVPALNFYKELV